MNATDVLGDASENGIGLTIWRMLLNEVGKLVGINEDLEKRVEPT